MAFPPLKEIWSSLSGSSGTPSPPSSQDHHAPSSSHDHAYPPRQENLYRSLSSQHTGTERFSLPMLSASGDLLPDPATPRLNRSSADTPERALPIPPAPQCTPAQERGYWEVMELVPMSPPRESAHLAGEQAFTDALVTSLVDSGAVLRSSTPLGSWNNPEDRPYGYQAQTFSPVPGFTPKHPTAFSTPGTETAPLMPTVPEPASPTPSMGARRHGYTKVPSTSSPLSSPKGSLSSHRSMLSPTNSTGSRRSLLGSLRSPLSPDSGSLKARLSPLVYRAPGPFPWAASASPARSKGKARAGTPPVAGPRAPRPAVQSDPTPLAPPSPSAGNALVPPPLRRLVTPPARGSSMSPLPAPKPAPAVQLLSQRTMAMFDTFSESSDGHSPQSASTEQHDVNPCRPLFSVGRVGSRHLVFDRGQATIGSKRLPARSEVVAAEGGAGRVVVHKRSVESMAAPSEGTLGDMREDQAGV